VAGGGWEPVVTSFERFRYISHHALITTMINMYFNPNISNPRNVALGFGIARATTPTLIGCYELTRTVDYFRNRHRIFEQLNES
jgi:hypothetical protein